MSSILALPMVFRLGEMNLPFCPTILHDSRDLILVDCGYPGYMLTIENEMNKKGLSLSQLSKIVITHHDHDHIGALREIVDQYPTIEILCAKKEAPYITGKSKSLRLLQVEAIYDSLPENEKAASMGFQNFIASIKKVDNVTTINGGDVLAWCGGTEIVDTKGHTPGHISLYVRNENTLIAGDALIVENEKLCMAMPEFILNTQDARNSIRNLLHYDIKKVICYHGGIYDTDIKQSLNRIIEDFH